MISIVIVSYKTRDILRGCLTALWAHPPGFEMEVFVVDNHSADGSTQMVRREFPQVRLIANSENRGFAAANNQAFRLAKGRYVVLLNPDAFVKPGAINAAVAFMEHTPQCGISGARLVDPRGRLDPSARRFPTWPAKLFTLSGMSSRYPSSPVFNRHDFGGFAHDRPRKVDWVPGTFAVLRARMLAEIGFFDERFFIYYEETDLCRRARHNGWQVYFAPDAEVVHIGGACSQTRTDKVYDPAGAQVLSFRMRSEWLYHRKNGGLLTVLANAGVELGWHLLRLWINRLPGRPAALSKRTASANVIRMIRQTLHDTAFGRRSPAAPW
ncbi:MAG: glycosyltransferase family 2 protein [Desulfobacterales bacterium]|nr:glycosyltransferase family 2 protein [Desulfobacterales bacterium]